MGGASQKDWARAGRSAAQLELCHPSLSFLARSLAHCLQSWLKRKKTVCVGHLSHRDLFNYESALRLFEQSEQFHNCSDWSEQL